MVRQPESAADVLLRRLYAGTRRALDGSPRQRSIVLQELVDDAIGWFDRLARTEDEAGVDRLFASAKVADIHPEVLDVLVALSEDMVLPSLEGFKDRVLGRLGEVDEILRPIELRRCDGTLISSDVRKDARAIYRERAKAFGDALRRDGNLDRFYRTKSKRGPARGEG